MNKIRKHKLIGAKKIYLIRIKKNINLWELKLEK